MRNTVSFLLLALAILLPGHAQETLNIYSTDNQSQIGQVPATAEYEVLAKQGDRHRVRFSKPTVTGWVSAQYVEIDRVRNSAQVAVDTLNFRLRPDVSSPQVLQVYRGYTSQVLASVNGFVNIYAPVPFEVLIDSGSGADGLQQASTGRLSDAGQAEPGDNETTVGELETTALTSPTQSSQTNRPEVRQPEKTHLLAPGDSISLQVFGEPDLSIQNVRVPQSGRVSFPLIGEVRVLGKTTNQVERNVARLLSQGYVKNPRLSVSIFSYRPIFIRGEVNSLGAFPYAEGLTVGKAVALAGGLSDSAKPDGISIVRDGKVVAEGLSVNSQVLVASGDIVSVDADLEVKEAESSFVFLHGEVAQAGAYEYRQGLTVEKAVVLAGGFTIRASKRKINISRYEQVSDDGEPVTLKRVKLYTPVKPGDVIKVGASWF